MINTFFRRTRHSAIARILCSHLSYETIMTEEIASHKTVPIDLLAHLTAPIIDVSVEEARSILEDSPENIDEFLSMMHENGMNIVYTDKFVSVLDMTLCLPESKSEIRSDSVDLGPIIDRDSGNYGQSKSIIRTLHFNESLDAVQSSVPLNSTSKQVDYSQKLPLDYCCNIVGMSFSFIFLSLNRRHQLSWEPKTSAVLGAGGCTLPIIISSIFPSCHVEAVETSHSVVHAARYYFGALHYERTNKLKINVMCAFDWLQKSYQIKSPSRLLYDLIFLDICDDSDVDENAALRAPPESSLQEDKLMSILSSLDDRGVFSINVLGSDDGTKIAAEHIYCSMTKISRALSCQFHVGIMKVKSAGSEGFDTSENKSKFQSQNDCTRYNSIVFIIKNPDIWFLNVDGKKLTDAKNLFLSNYNSKNQDVKMIDNSKVPFPFDRSDKILNDWIDSYKTIL